MLYKVSLLFLTILVLSRPISYPNSWTVIQENNENDSEFFAHYSLNVKNSLGFFYTKSHKEQLEDYFGIRWNYLLHRKNTKHSQWNIYLSNSLAITDNNEDNNLYQLRLNTDWETRRYLVSSRIEQKFISSKENFTKYRFRIGMAPYIGKYNDLHTWLILQLNYDTDNEIIVTPVIRLFKYIYLVEAGISSNGKSIFNFTIRL